MRGNVPASVAVFRASRKAPEPGNGNSRNEVSYELRFTNYGLRITSHEIVVSPFVNPNPESVSRNSPSIYFPKKNRSQVSTSTGSR